MDELLCPGDPGKLFLDEFLCTGDPIHNPPVVHTCLYSTLLILMCKFVVNGGEPVFRKQKYYSLLSFLSFNLNSICEVWERYVRWPNMNNS